MRRGIVATILIVVAGCEGPSAPADASPAAATVVAGTEFACALVDETAYCWGRNDLGQLGRSETAASGEPAPVAGDHRFRQLAAGSRNVCGVTDVAVLCWGHGGLLNEPEPIREPTVVPLTTSAEIMHVGVGLTHACALLATGSIWCWGENTGGQRGDGTTLQSPGPTAVQGGHSFSELSVGAVHSCARAAGEVWCWGLNAAVALGDGTSVDRAYILPEPVTLTFSPTAVTAGPAFTCVLDASSSVWCWGANFAGQLGRGASGDPTGVPGEVVGLEGVDEVFAPGVNSVVAHACALVDSAQAWCWGAADQGRLGRLASETCSAFSSDFPCSTQPAPVETTLRFTTLAPGADHTCGLTTDGAVYCWGGNDAGQLGSTASEGSAPVRVTFD